MLARGVSYFTLFLSHFSAFHWIGPCCWTHKLICPARLSSACWFYILSVLVLSGVGTSSCCEDQADTMFDHFPLVFRLSLPACVLLANVAFLFFRHMCASRLHSLRYSRSCMAFLFACGSAVHCFQPFVILTPWEFFVCYHVFLRLFCYLYSLLMSSCACASAVLSLRTFIVSSRPDVHFHNLDVVSFFSQVSVSLLGLASTFAVLYSAFLLLYISIPVQSVCYVCAVKMLMTFGFHLVWNSHTDSWSLANR